MADAVASSPTQQTSRHVSAASRRVPPGLLPVAVLLAAAVGLLALLPSLAQAAWEVPRLFLLGLVISYGVFAGQRNAADVHKAGDGDGDGGKDGAALACNARYHPDDPLVVVADHAACDDAHEGAMERPLSLPVRRLKPAAAQESETGDASDGAGEETDSSASSSGFWAGARAATSPPSVLDTDMSLSPASQPQSPPFFVHSTDKSRGFPGYHPSAPRDQPLSDDGEVTDWDEEADGSSDEMTASSERSVHGVFTACATDQNDVDGGDDDDTFVDEELFKMAVTAAAPEGKDEVDRKADEFIAKFREQLQRL